MNVFPIVKIIVLPAVYVPVIKGVISKVGVEIQFVTGVPEPRYKHIIPFVELPIGDNENPRRFQPDEKLPVAPVKV